MASDWQQYLPTVPLGVGAPYLSVSIVHKGAQVDKQKFMLDTGSSISFAPLHMALDLCDLSAIEEVDTQCLPLSAGGKGKKGEALLAKPVDVEILVHGFPPISERLWFRDCPFGVLGQSKFLETVGALFLNEPKAVGLGRFKLIPRSAFRPFKSKFA